MARFLALRGLTGVLLVWAGVRVTMGMDFERLPDSRRLTHSVATAPAPSIETGRRFVSKPPSLRALVTDDRKNSLPTLYWSKLPDQLPIVPAIPPSAARPVEPQIAAILPTAAAPEAVVAPQLQQRPSASPNGWRVSSWLLVRNGPSSQALATNGQLGGSQTGLRVTAPPLTEFRAFAIAPTLRMSSAVSPTRQQEGAIGISIARPFAGGRVEVLLERRFSIARGGRNDFAIGLAGGLQQDWPRQRIVFQGYAQSGFVGARSPDFYADGAASLEREIANDGLVRLSAGAGAWAATQPGVSRIDVGPKATAIVSVAGVAVRTGIDWRFRVAGNALPGSGPVVSMGADF